MAEGRWTLHPDRALPSEPTQRAIAREIYAATAALPLVSMHGHIDIDLILRNESFGDPDGSLRHPRPLPHADARVAGRAQ